MKASVSFTLSSYVENLILTGTGNIAGIGNGLANIITGSSGDNTLDGKAGADTMKGGKGNDTYFVDNTGDVVIEAKNGGVDTVRSSVSFRLGQHIEELKLTGSANISGTGNSMDNIVTGNAGKNRLDGGAGCDVLVGGKGRDIFVFSTKLNAEKNVDIIKDFSVVDDRIELDGAIFRSLSLGELDADRLAIGPRSTDPLDRIIYDADTGALSYDRDGSGSAKAVQFASLAAGLAISHDHFIIT